MASMAVHGGPFTSDAAIVPMGPSTTPGTPSLLETKEKEGDLGKPEEPAPRKLFFGWKSAKPRTQADAEKETPDQTNCSDIQRSRRHSSPLCVPPLRPM